MMIPAGPRHPQVMDPADDPEEFIAASIYWYPLLFPTRTDVLDHTFLCNGNGYEWNPDGKISSVFADIDPDLDRLSHYEDEARKYETKARDTDSKSMRDLNLEWAADARAQHRELLAVREDYRHLARTYGPVRLTEDYGPSYGGKRARMVTSRDLPWTLLGRAPAQVDPRWQIILNEVRDLFAPILIEQGTLFDGPERGA